MKKNIVHIVLGAVIIAAIAGGVGYFLGTRQEAKDDINSYKECVAAGYPILDSYPEQCRTPGGRNFTNTARTAEQSVSLEGKIVCLPHKETDGPQTLECMAGLQTDDGNYYMLNDASSNYELAGAAGSEKKVRLSGILKPGGDDIYQSKGVITVNGFEFM
jgi:hypothetical protein